MTTEETAPQDPATRNPAPEDPALQDPAPLAGPEAASGDDGRPGTRSGPIVWGALILVFCAFVAARSMGWVVDPTTWVIATIIGLGVLLLGVGVAVIVRNRSR